MGLDISAYRKLSKAGPEMVLDEDGEPQDYDTYVQVLANTHFPERLEGLDNEGFYKFQDTLRFRAGSYGSYNVWRSMLAKLAGFASDEAAWAVGKGPFYELIAFSDCEGDIGPVVSAKLVKDFARFEERAKTFAISGGDTWFFEKYTDWKNAFEMAADGGMVSFH